MSRMRVQVLKIKRINSKHASINDAGFMIHSAYEILQINQTELWRSVVNKTPALKGYQL